MRHSVSFPVLPLTAAAAMLLAASLPAHAQTAPREGFGPGPVFTEFGPIAAVDTTVAVSPDAVFQVAFDATTAADVGALNRTIESAARFINMHVAAGVAEENIRIAIVVHGGAAHDLTNAAFYGAHHEGGENGSADAIATLLEHGVRIYLCGQSAAAHGISTSDLLPGVDMALSAMTQHALLQQQGYTINPF